MKIVIWGLFGLAALLWTGAAFVMAGLTRWAAQALVSGEAASLGREAAQWPVPQWIALWVDPALVESMQAALLWSLEILNDALPLFGSMVDWLVPLVWVLWGLGLLTMLLLAVGAHVLVGRGRKLRSRSR